MNAQGIRNITEFHGHYARFVVVIEEEITLLLHENLCHTAQRQTAHLQRIDKVVCCGDFVLYKGELPIQSGFVMLGLGMFCVGISLLNEKK